MECRSNPWWNAPCILRNVVTRLNSNSAPSDSSKSLRRRNVEVLSNRTDFLKFCSTGFLAAALWISSTVQRRVERFEQNESYQSPRKLGSYESRNVYWRNA